MSGGRPSLYSEALAAKIFAQIMDGNSIRWICQAEDMPDCSTVFDWLARHPEFAHQYARAREIQAELMADDIVAIADDGRNDTYKDEHGRTQTNQDVINRSRLRVDARKWVAAKLLPKKYGDKVQQEVTGSGGGPLVFTVSKIGE